MLDFRCKWVYYKNTMDELSKDLKNHVRVLSQDIGERNFMNYDLLERAADYITEKFKDYGYMPGDQDYYLEGKRFRNIIATKLGDKIPKEIIIVGAHYDSVIGSPGADDNASAVAGLLEMAHFISTMKVARTIKFVAFTNEEPPFFQTKQMGSMIYAKCARSRGEAIVAMISLEMIGYYSDKNHSQSYPLGFGLFYPNTANFIAVCGNLRSRSLARNIKEEFKKHSSFGIETLVVPEFLVPPIDFSDNGSFWNEGYRAVMITDTAFYRNPHYHSPEDTFEKLDYISMAEVVKGLYNVILAIK